MSEEQKPLRQGIFHRDALIIMGGPAAEQGNWFGRCLVPGCMNTAKYQGGDRRKSGWWCGEHRLEDLP